jgi:hypothetical protein
MKKYTPPPTPKKGYSFIPAGTIYKNLGNICIYVKYKGFRKKSELTLLDVGANHIKWSCPDRELLIVRHNDQLDSARPIGENYDECVDLNLFNDRISKSLGLDYIMTNYAHSSSSNHKRIISNLPKKDRITVLSDSGGLQMMRRLDEQFKIHPKDLVEFYNNNTDAGMVLDVPTFSIDDLNLKIKTAQVQRKMTNIMLKHAKKGVELINIFHGRNNYERSHLRGIVEDTRITRCAIGGVQSQGLLTLANAIYDIAYEGEHYKQYHILGVFKTTHIPILVSIANKGPYMQHITSDSTNHIQAAVNRQYYHQIDITHPLVSIPIGQKISYPNSEKILPCQCIVCKTVKYTDILAFSPTEMIRKLIILHNMLCMVRYSRQLQEARVSLDDKGYEDLVYKQLHRSAHLKEVKNCFNFVKDVEEKGLKTARKKYVFFLDTGKEKADIRHSLFDGDSIHMIAKDKYLKLIKGLERSL